MLAFILIVTFMIGEFVAGLLSGSLALIADSGHMLTDVATLALTIWSLRLATRPPAAQWTYGFKRAEIVSAAVNGAVLGAVAIAILVQAGFRLGAPTSVHGVTMIFVAAVGVVVNLAALGITARTNRANLNLRSAFVHLVTDVWATGGTLVAGIVIETTHFVRADALASIFVALLMVMTSLRLLRDSGRILLEAAPKDIDLVAIQRHLMDVTHVVSVHDLHVWVVTSDLPALSAHVVLEDVCFFDGYAARVLDELQSCLAGHFDVAHSTFQMEMASHVDHEDSSH